MEIDNKTNRFIFLPWLIAAVVGVWLITNTCLITKDGPQYINSARAFGENPLEVIRGHSFGYPAMLFVTYKITGMFGVTESPHNLAVIAQSMTLVCMLVAMVLIYKIAKHIVGKRDAFLTVLILSLLPYPMRFGSDVLREWPNMMFLFGGLVALWAGTKNTKFSWVWFGVIGIMGGLGYMIRAEMGQVVLYGIIWLAYCFFKPQQKLGKSKTIVLAVTMIACFAIIILPYMHTKGQYLPEKLEELIENSSTKLETAPNIIPDIDEQQNARAGVVGDLANSFVMLGKRISENMMYYFFVFFLLGVYVRIKQCKKQITNFEKIIIISFLALNIIITVLLYYNHGYMSRRHCLAMSVVCLFYVPSGLRAAAGMLEEKFGRQNKDPQAKFWFALLLIVGVCLCVPKLVADKRTDRTGYLKAAEWLNKNTPENAIITVPDLRISFYADRAGLEGWGIDALTAETDYWVSTIKTDEPLEGWGTKLTDFPLDGKNTNEMVVIHQR